MRQGRSAAGYRFSVLVLIAMALVAAPPPASAQAVPVAVDDLRLEVGLSSPRLSPDGRYVVVVTSRPNYVDNRFDRGLALVDVTTGETLDLTPHRPRVGQPRWSPSGLELAFLDRADGEPPQVFVLPLAGGEARRVTEADDGVASFHWSADGERILYTTTDPAPEKEGEEKHNRSFEVGNNSYLTQEAPSPRHLWVVGAHGGDAERLTRGGWSITDFMPSPDGRSVALEVTPAPHTGELIRTGVHLLDVDTGALDELTDRSPSFLVSPASGTGFAPGGRILALSSPTGEEPFFNPAGIFLQPLDGGPAREVTERIDRQIGGMVWLPDGESMLVTGVDLTQGAMWLQPPDEPATRLDLSGIHPGSDLGVSEDGTVVFLGRDSHRPAEVYTMRVGEWSPRRLTGFNDALAEKRYGRVETVEWDGPDGFRQNGVLRYPPDFEEGREYPLALSIHGGPMGASTEAYGTFDHILAAQGWLVFSPNYRGSSTQGKAFQTAVIDDAGEGPGRDVMSGVEAVKAKGIVDDRRVAVSGWSYGGYMTAWLTAHYDGWTVAMAGAAVTDWFDWYTMADMNTWAGFGLNGSPWTNDNAMNYWRQSPMAYAHQIRTPTLILSTTGDERVTVSQSYKLYHALKDNGVEVQFIAYPVPGHFPPDPVHQRDVRRRWVEWIQEHFDRATSTRTSSDDVGRP